MMVVPVAYNDGEIVAVTASAFGVRILGATTVGITV
jgi:hypothetical protein